MHRDDLATWKVAFDEALEAARDNLRARSPEEFEPVAPGVFRSPWRDESDAARLLLPELFRGLPVRGDPVALAPERSTLLVTGSEDEAGLVRMAGLAHKAFQEPYGVSGIALRLGGEEWVPFLPGQESPAYGPMRSLQLESFQESCNDQIAVLTALYGGYVASFMVKDAGPQGAFSACTWSNIPCQLLPRTDFVCFVQRKGERTFTILAIGKWERVREVVGGLMEPLDVYPERYRVQGFPSPGQLAEIGLCELPGVPGKKPNGQAAA